MIVSGQNLVKSKQSAEENPNTKRQLLSGSQSPPKRQKIENYSVALFGLNSIKVGES